VQTLIYVIGTDGRRTREMIDDGNGQQYLSRLYTYDSNGQKTAEAVYHMCGTFSSLLIDTYDRAGLLREDLTYQCRSIVKHVYDYDEGGRLKSRTSYANGALRSTAHYEYVDKIYPV
jgi:YD repeat-containing protein